MGRGPGVGAAGRGAGLGATVVDSGAGAAAAAGRAGAGVGVGAGVTRRPGVGTGPGGALTAFAVSVTGDATWAVAGGALAAAGTGAAGTATVGAATVGVAGVGALAAGTRGLEPVVLGAAASVGFSLFAGNASCSLRTTGGSIVEAADFTYSPLAANQASASLLVIPISLATRLTRTFDTSLLSRSVPRGRDRLRKLGAHSSELIDRSFHYAPWPVHCCGSSLPPKPARARDRAPRTPAAH